MDQCALDPDTVIGTNSTDNSTLVFSDFAVSLANIAPCGAPTYLRPDPGGCLLPWPYTLAWILVHLPVTVLRVNRWEKVMVWMPLAIVLDVGAMMQLVFLVIQENGVVLLWAAFKQLLMRPFRPQRRPSIELIRQDARGENNNVAVHVLEPEPVPQDRDLAPKALITLLALLLLVTLVILQFVGLANAARGRKTDDLAAVWCSPMFQSGEAVLATPARCQSTPLPVDRSASQGIGCVRLPADDQRRWLTATVAVLSASLVAQVVDAAVLVLVGNNARWWRARMKRPWCTMILGNGVLISILIAGIISSSDLPRYVDRTVWVFKYERSVDTASVCRGTLISAGVRGSIIGWTDGFLHSWGETYSGF
ncbi:hypothetical protein VDGE_05702 [Verticillium dahliae]|uniref:Uncharacterized protein n=1 Tax=Verticillium dahliae TaxID=27337 RepID=A0A444S7I1_VERDA|nr:hypothetical protein VDGE_05702 [Verticillium dahliae]